MSAWSSKEVGVGVKGASEREKGNFMRTQRV